MNKNQINGSVKGFVGKVQQEVGIIIGNKKQQVKGLHKQNSGRAERTLGDAQEQIKDAHSHN